MTEPTESYIHRIGRTGRAGGDGIAITLVTPKDRMSLRLIEKGIKTTIKKKTFDALTSTEPKKEKKTERPKPERKERTERPRTKGRRRTGPAKPAAGRSSTSVSKKRRMQGPNRKGK